MLRVPLISLALVALVWWLVLVAKRARVRAAVLIVALLIAVPLAFFWSLWIHEAHMKYRARDLNARLDAYRVSHGQYPVSLLDLGISEVNGPIYYQRDFSSPLVYHLSFEYAPHSLAEYDSDTKRWDYNP